MGEDVSDLSLLPLRGPERKSLLQNIFQIKVSNKQSCQQMPFLFPEFSVGVFSEVEFFSYICKAPKHPRAVALTVPPIFFNPVFSREFLTDISPNGEVKQTPGEIIPIPVF